MRVLIVGPQGAGKGTQATLLAENLGVPHVSTGDLFRLNIGHGTALGKTVQTYMDKGELVPDEVTSAMVAARLEDEDMVNGWILDGFPRNLSQAKWLGELLAERGSALTSVLVIDAPDEILMERMMARGRADDTADAIQRRLAIYHAETVPLVEFYGDLVLEVDGVGEISEVQHRILRALGRSDLEHG
ncbi:adenylate kinase [Nakamurella deserti]|uniref:adenylate kinase n=1 Tax=Nakamurella deserti TaxID=2164074 RepID=UPI000DBE2CAD|nr:adenylate kinase [Nakamurella deserti]